ncbi:ABC transporter permease [Rhodopila sp.]|uniref:ABC transporter permease n=1 Tax=Rhodopila sp. TaxID=2480087 RepID=UPI003D0BD2AE
MSSAVTMPAVSTTAPTAVLDLNADMSVASRNRLALGDLMRGLRLWRLAWALGWLDIRLRYRGSMLGPFWLTISTGVMVAALGMLYSTLFKMDLRNYLPFLALSQVLWGFLAALVSEACTTFTDAEGIIRSVRMPFFVFSTRTLIRNLIALAHNIVVIVVVFAVFSLWPGWNALLALPALLLWVLDALALTLLLGSFCARFRDIQPIVNSVMQIMFFVTPVIWKPEQLGASAAKLPLNPFFDLLEIVRGPLLGDGVSRMTWLGAIGYSAVLCGVSWAFFVRARGRVTFWI